MSAASSATEKSWIALSRTYIQWRKHAGWKQVLCKVLRHTSCKFAAAELGIGTWCTVEGHGAQSRDMVQSLHSQCAANAGAYTDIFVVVFQLTCRNSCERQNIAAADAEGALSVRVDISAASLTAHVVTHKSLMLVRADHSLGSEPVRLLGEIYLQQQQSAVGSATCFWLWCHHVLQGC
jgi:hypothetical protein